MLTSYGARYTYRHADVLRHDYKVVLCRATPVAQLW